LQIGSLVTNKNFILIGASLPIPNQGPSPYRRQRSKNRSEYPLPSGVPSPGFEPGTISLKGSCSTRLSYKGTPTIKRYSLLFLMSEPAGRILIRQRELPLVTEVIQRRLSYKGNSALGTLLNIKKNRGNFNLSS
jgi:hypothetical protein